jgi:integrase/ribosomal protein L37AE/L43A
MTQKNKNEKLIQDYLLFKRATAKEGRLEHIEWHLVKLAKYIQDYRTATLSSITLALGDLQEMEPDLEDNYLHTLGITLKTFMKWMVKEGHNKRMNLDDVKEIPITDQILVTKTSGDMWTPEEVNRLLKACIHSRDRALIVVLYEGALRVSEALRLKVSDITSERSVITLHISAKVGRKTKQVRTVPIIQYREHLARYLSERPAVGGDDRVFVPLRSRYDFKPNAIRMMLATVQRRSGVNKKISPHLLRHSGLTQKAVDGMNPVTMSMIGWGQPVSKMLSVYTHLSGGNVVNSAMDLYGQAGEQVKKEPRRAPQCPQCGNTDITPDMDYCSKCGQGLTEKAKSKAQEVQDDLDRRIKEMVQAELARQRKG